MARFTFVVDIDITHTSGRFESHDVIAARLKEELESAGEEVQLYGFRPGGDLSTEYSLDSWIVRRVEASTQQD